MLGTGVGGERIEEAGYGVCSCLYPVIVWEYKAHCINLN